MAELRLKAANAASIRFFIGILHLQSGEMSGFDGAKRDCLEIGGVGAKAIVSRLISDRG
jgi:hypothetical protein